MVDKKKNFNVLLDYIIDSYSHDKNKFKINIMALCELYYGNSIEERKVEGLYNNFIKYKKG